MLFPLFFCCFLLLVLGDRVSSVLIETSGASEMSPVVPLITGCGRAGTHTIAELLNSLRINAIHEGASLDAVAVSWFYGVNQSFSQNDNMLEYKIANKLIKFSNIDKRTHHLKETGVRFYPVIHIVRNPLQHIAATSRCICSKGDRDYSGKTLAWDKMSWAFIKQHIHIPEGSSELTRSAWYWLLWNEMIEKNAIGTFKIEEFNPKYVIELLKQKTNVNMIKEIDSDSIPTSISIRAASSGVSRHLSWDRLLAEVGQELASRIDKTAHRYGYELH